MADISVLDTIQLLQRIYQGDFREAGFRYVGNIFDNKGQLLQWGEVEKRGIPRKRFLDWFGIVAALPREWEREVDKTNLLALRMICWTGSFGKGTQIKGLADLDCILILNDIVDLDDHKARVGDIKKDILKRLLDDPEWKEIIENPHTSKLAIKFNVIVADTGETMGVDLLPIFDSLGDSPTDEERFEFYEKIIGIKNEDAEIYNISLCQFQRDFIRDMVPEHVKDLIRLVKYWKKVVADKVIPKKLRKPTCQQLELLTVYVWETAGKPEDIDMAQAFKAVLHQVVYYKDLDVAWYYHYTEDIARRAKKSMTMPIMLDPGNPTTNTFMGSDLEAWEYASKTAKENLNSPLLKDIDIPNEWLGTRKYLEGTVPCWCL
ncbi:2'-5'-oligoadenylate synthase 1-like [Saccoglossus kowalevskii]